MTGYRIDGGAIILVGKNGRVLRPSLYISVTKAKLVSTSPLEVPLDPSNVTHSLNNSLTHLLIHSLIHSLTFSLTHFLTFSLNLLTHSLTQSLSHSGGGGGKALTMTMTPWNLTHGQWSKKLTIATDILESASWSMVKMVI